MKNYVTLVGYVQSGKTNEEINFCYQSINIHKLPVIFITRNIKVDITQLLERINLFNEHTQSKIVAQPLHTIDLNRCSQFLNNLGVIICLYNPSQLLKLKKVLTVYTGEYNLCIDEVDFCLKNNEKSLSEYHLNDLKESATYILGATATPYALFSSEKKVSLFKKLETSKYYKGLNHLEIKYVEPNIMKHQFPESDEKTMNDMYTQLSLKDECRILHTVCREKRLQFKLMDYLNIHFKKFAVVVYNGDGIYVKYNESLNGKFNESLNHVLQILKENNVTHVSIISGNLASRGISFVSSDYMWHLTDQYFHPGKTTHGENLLQSLRILGCYQDDKPITLWCHKNTWKLINEQFKLLETLINQAENCENWFVKIQNVVIKKPARSLTRPRIMKNTKWINKKNGNYLLNFN
jgi:hypothetical protein